MIRSLSLIALPSLFLLGLFWSVYSVADSRAPTFQLNSVEFKPDARIEADLLLECDVKKTLAMATEKLHSKHQTMSKKKTAPVFEVEVRIDRLVRVQPLSGPGGTELAI